MPDYLLKKSRNYEKETDVLHSKVTLVKDLVEKFKIARESLDKNISANEVNQIDMRFAKVNVKIAILNAKYTATQELADKQKALKEQVGEMNVQRNLMS